MGRLLTMTTTNLSEASDGSFEMTYQYDAVGSAREMVQDSWNLAGQATNATTYWEYDDRYRLTNETVTVDDASSFVNSSTDYTWDSADNRLSKTVSIAGGSPTTTLYTNNALNQITGWGNGNTNVTYAYDANGARTNMIRTAGGSPVATSYTYDEDNRLIEAVAGAVTNQFAYDYRSRRYYRATSTETNICVFDGGLSIQEYDATSSLTPQTSNLLTEFIRGEGMGGGVGGMVYSIKDGGTENEDIICSHANHRGDVIARSDKDDSLTSFALYEAYGTRPYEWGSDSDRQKANTKEEEKDLGLLNEGMRYRDLETGTFLTRDPIGYADGPNVYCYVHCNPITHFDPLGLKYTWVGTDQQVTQAEQMYQEMYDQVSPEIQKQLDQYAAPDSAEIKIQLVTKDKEVRIGSYDKETIDLGDIASLPKKDNPMTQSAAFGHEVMEQSVKQTQGLKNRRDEAGNITPEGERDFQKAHAEGLKVEESANGGFRRTKDDQKQPERINKNLSPGEPQILPAYGRFFHQRDGATTLFGKSKEAYITTITDTPDGGISAETVPDPEPVD